MRALRLVVVAAAWIGGMAVPGCGGASGTTVAVVDMQRALRECQEGRTASEQLRALYASRQADLDRRQEQIRTTQAGIVAAQGQGQNVATREAAMQQDMMALQRDFQTFQQELSDAEQRATAHILERLKTALQALAHQHAVDLVLDTTEVAASGTRVVDLTSDLIRSYDAHPPTAH